MHFWLVVGVLIVWFLLVCGAFYGWRRLFLGGFTTLGTLAMVTLVAVILVLVYGPYWEIVYRTVLQPG